jgi:hypothetical protein
MPVRLALAAGAVAVSLAVEAAAVLANGEIGRLALRRLAFGSGQRCSNQRPMDRPLVLLVTRDRLVRFRLARLRDDIGSIRFNGRRDRRRFVEKIDRFGHQLLVDDWSFGIGDGRTRGGRALRGGDKRGLWLLAARRRHLGLFVLMVRVAGGAASLLHLVFNHGDDRMIRDAALARTIVVQNVTEPNPALLHELPRKTIAFRVG